MLNLFACCGSREEFELLLLIYCVRDDTDDMSVPLCLALPPSFRNTDAGIIGPAKTGN
jgi:hypothetical protein